MLVVLSLLSTGLTVSVWKKSQFVQCQRVLMLPIFICQVNRSRLSRGATTKKELSGQKKYQEPLETHAIAHLAFKSRNVVKSTCEYCSPPRCPPRCPPEVFQGLSFVPEPLLDSTGSRFLSFGDDYGIMVEYQTPRRTDHQQVSLWNA